MLLGKDVEVGKASCLETKREGRGGKGEESCWRERYELAAGVASSLYQV